MNKPERKSENKALDGRAAQRASRSPRAAQPGDIELSSGSVETQCGYITNRPPSNPITNSGGEDWFEVSLYLQFLNFDRLSKQLDAAREAAEAGEEGEDTVTFGGVNFLVLPGGASAGSPQKRIYFRWRLQSENGLLIQLMNRETPHRTVPNGNLRATSLLLMQLGAERVWHQALAMLHSMGCTVERNKLSRVDPCVDLPEMGIQSLYEPYSAGHCITRARVNRTYRREDHVVEMKSAVHSFGHVPTGFVVGQGDLKLRVYDKFRESNQVVEKIATVVGCRWGYFTITASRVEFQIRRETLKSLGVDTVADWFEKRAEICEYLCTKWFRLTSGPVDRKHPDRSETLPEWLHVQRAFADWAGKPDYIELHPLATEECFPTNLIQQAIGLFVSYFARTGTKIDDDEAFLDQAVAKMAESIGARNMATEIQRKAAELGLLPVPYKEFENNA